MKLIINPDKRDWLQLLQRPYNDNSAIQDAVQEILSAVKTKGDEAVKDFTQKFDGIELNELVVSEAEIAEAQQLISASLKAAIIDAAANIRKFHEAQISQTEKIETTPGVFCWRKSVAIEKVGLYVPGGTAPLFSTVLMLAIPAQIAGCAEIILCTPANREGKVPPAILFAAEYAGVKKIFKIGGAQAIAAMAYGTETVPAVYKIFGPGNQYVTASKQLVQMEGVAIDMPAGPSEVCVLADDSANPEFIAADLLSQAEHGVDSQVLLVTTSEELAAACMKQVKHQLEKLPRKEIAGKALQNSKAIVLPDLDKAIDLINDYAAEHLIICCNNPEALAESVKNAGSVFIGNYSPESVGDYASGTNHTLPTNGFAKAFSGVSVDSFAKKITFQKLSEAGLYNIGHTVITMAEAEGLRGHADAVRVRLDAVAGAGDVSHPEEFLAFDLDRITRNNIKGLKPYSSARSEFKGSAKIFLDANENSFGSPLTKWYNRYPDPLQWDLKKKISTIKNVPAEQMLLGNGSDECIDLLVRAFCEPGEDSILICPPTYGMYEVTAGINNVAVKEVPLLPNFQLNLDGIEAAVDAHTKIIFICSPNNPTGNSMEREDVEIILNNFSGLVVIDEAYINYSRHRSFLAELHDYPNLVVLQTFSKAWGLAALRLGMLFASTEVVQILNKIKPPYNINQPTQELAMQALDHLDDVNTMITETVKEREALIRQLVQLPFVQRIFPSDANFLLVRMENANDVYDYLIENGIVVRNRSSVILCDDALRITIGTPDQDRKLVECLAAYNSK